MHPDSLAFFKRAGSSSLPSLRHLPVSLWDEQDLTGIRAAAHRTPHATLKLGMIHLRIELREINRDAPGHDELHRWAAILFRPSGRSVPKTDRSPLPKSRYSSFAPSSGVTRASKAKRLSRFWVLSLCTPSARSDTSSYLSRLRISSGPGPCPRGPAHR